MTGHQKGAIAAGHPLTVEAGLEMFRLGGNAFDAAIAAMMASWVTEPALTSPGGGGFCLAHTGSRGNILFDFFTQTPRQKLMPAESDFFPIVVDFGGVKQEFHVGMGSIAVPGSLEGAFHIHHRLGKLPLQAIAEPAIDYARNGVVVSKFQQYVLSLLEPILTASLDMRQVYAPKGHLLEVGESWRMVDLANSLEFLVEEGPATIREGDFAHQIVRDCQEGGGHLTLEDLAQYRTLERQPLTIDYRGHTLLSNPPPSFGGTLIAFCLKLLEGSNLGQSFEFGSLQHISLLARSMHQTHLARGDCLNGSIYNDGIASRFLSPEAIATYRAGLAVSPSKLGSTTHISTVDREGNAASITASNGEGSGYAIPGTGIMLNNMLGEDDLNPDGFHRWPTNQRMSSMMAPTMVLKRGKPEIVLGSGGSKRIRTAIAQVISNLLDFDMPVAQAVGSPRIHWDDSKLNLEPGFEDLDLSDLGEVLGDSIVPWSEQNMYFGGVHTVARREDGSFVGEGDRRRDGFANWV